MALVPLRYNLRSLFVRSSATALTVCAIGATVAVLAGMLSLQQVGQGLLHLQPLPAAAWRSGRGRERDRSGEDLRVQRNRK